MVSGRSWLHLPACSGGITFQPPFAEVRRSRRLFGWPSVYHTNLARQSAWPAPDRDYQMLSAANPWPHPNALARSGSRTVPLHSRPALSQLMFRRLAETSIEKAQADYV